MSAPRKNQSDLAFWAPFAAVAGIAAALPLVSAGCWSVAAGHGWVWPARNQEARAVAAIYSGHAHQVYGAATPDGTGMWATFAVLAVLIIGLWWWALNLLAAHRIRRVQRAEVLRTKERTSSTAWAKPSETSALALPGALHWLAGEHGRHLIHCGFLESLAVIAPTGAGKTARFVVPNFFTSCAYGVPRVLATVKTDAVALTWQSANEAGPVWVFAPGSRGFPLCRWNPLSRVHSWGDALSVAGWLSRSQRADSRESDHMNYWNTLGIKMLAPMVFLAAVTGQRLGAIQTWVETTDETGVREQLRGLPITVKGREDAIQAWQATCAREPRAKSSVFGTAEVILDGFSHPDVRGLMDGDESEADVYTPAKLLAQRGTLYIFATTREKVQQYGAVYDAMMAELIAHVADASAATGRPISSGLAVILEEAANIARIRDLAYLASAGRGMGMHLMSVWQDMHQIETLYGAAEAKSILANHLWTAWLPGTRDPDSVKALTSRVSTFLREDESSSVTDDGSGSVSSRQVDQDALTARDIAGMGEDQAILLGWRKPMWVTTTPYYRHADLRALVGEDVAAEFDRALGGPR